MQVFISYAHTKHDSNLARWLANAFRKAGLSPWFDDSDTSPGDPVESTLRQAIDASDAAVFLISRCWLERSWTIWELNQFATRELPCERLVPVLRGPTSELQRLIPAYLTRCRHIEWPTDKAEALSAFWNVYCGVTGQRPGPREHWNAQAGALIGGTEPPSVELPRPVWDPAAPRTHPGQQRVSLRCDRTQLWGLIETHAQEPASELLLIPGPRGQGHEHFLVRVEGELRRDPPRNVIALQWPRRPASQNDYLEALASHLELEVGPHVDLRPRLQERIATLLGHQNLVLLHPPIRSHFFDDELATYYVETLPGLLSRREVPFHLKCVQPLKWRSSGSLHRLAARMTRMMWAGAGEAEWIEEASEESDAYRLIKRLKDTASSALRVVPLPVLGEVPDVEIIQFFDRLGLSDAQRRRLLARIRSTSHTPEELFQAIDEYYPELCEVR
jgi:TIR domain